MDKKTVNEKVNAALALEVRTPETVVHCVGVEFVEQLEHLTTMLCEKNLDLAMLKKMFRHSTASKTRKRKRKQQKRSVKLRRCSSFLL
jgi:hypothetical protein